MSILRAVLLFAAALGIASSRAAAGQFEILRTRIAADNLQSIEEVLSVLPVGLRWHYTLMFRSRSLQGASYENPRAILYGRDATFIVTFNGDSGQAGFNALETIEFDESSRRFVFRELTFPDRPGAGPVSFSEDNPAKCAACHGNPPRPVWDTFPLWPGAYGERYRSRLTREESDGLNAFLARQPNHPRYSVLRKVDALASREAFFPSAKTRYQGVETEPPNSELTTLLSKLNFQVIAGELASAPRFPAYQFALLAAASPGCGDIREFFPPDMAAEFDLRYAEFARQTERANQRQDRAKAGRTIGGQDYGEGRGSAQDDSAVQKLRFIVEAGLGVNTAQWSLALEKNSYDYSALEGSGEALVPLLMARVSASDGAVADLSPYRTYTNDDRYCAHLRRQSRIALNGVRLGVAAAARAPDTAAPAVVGREPDSAAAAAAAPPVSRAGFPGGESSAPMLESGHENAAARLSALPPPPLLSHCAQCHSSGVAPAIPFGDAERLAQMLDVPGYPRGTLMQEILFRLSSAAGAARMPLDLNISDTERKGLEEYFRSLRQLYEDERRASQVIQAGPSGAARASSARP